MNKICILLFFISIKIFSDTFHNVNGFFGEKAPGLSGAYTAVSDDPAGAYYNPAGLAFTYDNSISLSASNITKIHKGYLNALGPGQGYQRDSQNYIPNFFGVVKEYKTYRVAFSILNTLNETFTRNDQIVNPVYFPRFASARINNTESYNQVQTGVSIAKSITDKFSVGATLYYTYDTTNITNANLIQFTNLQFQSGVVTDRRDTRGFLPILGIMYMPTTKISLGLSIRRQFVTSGNRLFNLFTTSSFSNSNRILLQEGTDEANGGRLGSTPIIYSPLNNRIPETTDVRAGFAVFPSKRLMASFDTIYTSGFNRKQNQYEMRFGGGARNYLLLQDSEVQELKLYSTTNFAFGTEYYLTDNFALRLGGFTNNANTRNVPWHESATLAYLRENRPLETISKNADGQIDYKLGSLRTPVRNEYVNLIGGSFGFAWATSKTSFGVTIVKEYGRGSSQIIETSPIQTMVYDSTALYVIVSSKSN